MALRGLLCLLLVGDRLPSHMGAELKHCNCPVKPSFVANSRTPILLL